MGYESGYTGGLIEHEAFNKPNLGKYFDAHPPIGEYVPYNQAMSALRKLQRWDPSDPRPQFSNDLHATIAETLSPEDYSKVRIYTAVGTQLDRFHSVDAFVDFEDGDSFVTVTIDVTSNPHKDRHKADVIIYIPGEGIDRSDGKEGKEEYMAVINRSATAIVSIIRSRLTQKAR